MNRASLFTLFASLLLAIVVAEVALRTASISYPEFNRLDSRLGWAPRPGVEGIYAFEGRTYLRINAQGFRDVDHEVAKPEGFMGVLDDWIDEKKSKKSRIRK